MRSRLSGALFRSEAAWQAEVALSESIRLAKHRVPGAQSAGSAANSIRMSPRLLPGSKPRRTCHPEFVTRPDLQSCAHHLLEPSPARVPVGTANTAETMPSPPLQPFRRTDSLPVSASLLCRPAGNK